MEKKVDPWDFTSFFFDFVRKINDVYSKFRNSFERKWAIFLKNIIFTPPHHSQFEEMFDEDATDPKLSLFSSDPCHPRRPKKTRNIFGKGVYSLLHSKYHFSKNGLNWQVSAQKRSELVSFTIWTTMSPKTVWIGKFYHLNDHVPQNGLNWQVLPSERPCPPKRSELAICFWVDAPFWRLETIFVSNEIILTFPTAQSSLQMDL